jgi:hypothetical protein
MIAQSPHARVSRWEVEDPEEIEDELDTAAASCDHFAAMGSKELDMMRLPSCVPTLTGSQRESRCEVLRFVLQTVQRLSMPKDHFFYVVQLLDAAGIWGTTHFRQQTLAGMAALAVSVKMCCDHVRGVGVDALPGLADHATKFLDGTAHQGAVSPEDIVTQERNLLAALNFVVSAPTVSDWIEVLFRRTEVTSAGRATQLHRFAAEVAKDFCEVLLFQVNLSEKKCPSDVAISMWSYALMITCWMAAVASRR